MLIEQSQKNIDSVNLDNLTMMSFAVGKVSDENGEYSYLSRNNSDNTANVCEPCDPYGRRFPEG